MTMPNTHLSQQFADSRSLLARTFQIAAIVLLAFAASHTYAQENCFEASGKKYKRDPLLYYAIAEVESNRNPKATNRSHVGRTSSVDIGVMQINSRNLPALEKRGVTREGLENDPCLNVDVGASILEEKIARYGYTWNAVGAYNAACTQLKGDDCRRARETYARKVWNVYSRVAEKAGAAVNGLHIASHAPSTPAKKTRLRITEEKRDVEQ